MTPAKQDLEFFINTCLSCVEDIENGFGQKAWGFEDEFSEEQWQECQKMWDDTLSFLQDFDPAELEALRAENAELKQKLQRQEEISIQLANDAYYNERPGTKRPR